jgi:DNA repair protein RadA/Sms
LFVKKKVKKNSRFVCEECGFVSAKWLGRCPDCGQWDSLAERRLPGKTAVASAEFDKPQPLSRSVDQQLFRAVTAIEELDRVLGGGIVPGGVVLIGGDPGIGKSTLLLHMLSSLASRGLEVLYVSGEESAHQIGIRAERLSATTDNLYLATESSVETIIAMSLEMKPALLAVDSIQTLTSADHPSAAGSITQVRESAARLVELAKQENMPVVLVGHVTKEGTLAGPRILEHMVDTVLYFEGDRNHVFRILRTVKNRFGSTNEIGVFEMKEEGLVEVANPSEIFLAERPLDVAGSVVLASMEGTRPILVEVQALVSPTNLGTARRTAIGADPQRLSLLCAILEKKGGLDLYGHDIFLNIAGGMRVDEPALDLGVIAALASSMLEKPVPPDTVVCGEVGLAGEVRAVAHIDLRIRESQRLGFSQFILPKTNFDRCAAGSSLELRGVASIQEFLELINARH